MECRRSGGAVQRVGGGRAEVEVALPVELEDEQAGISLVCEFLHQEFVARGMVADLTINLSGDNPYANAMLTVREVTSWALGARCGNGTRLAGCG